MDTDALIAALARDTAPISRRAVERRLSLGAVIGVLVSLAVLVMTLGLRPDLRDAVRSTAFWAQAGVALSLAFVGLNLSGQLARPDCRRLRWPWLASVPVAIGLSLAAMEPTGATAPPRGSVVLEPAWYRPSVILLLAVPILAGLVREVRRLAPTRLRAAGSAAGLAAGGLAATLHGLSSQQVSPFHHMAGDAVAIALASAAGALLGPRLMRW